MIGNFPTAKFPQGLYHSVTAVNSLKCHSLLHQQHCASQPQRRWKQWTEIYSRSRLPRRFTTVTLRQRIKRKIMHRWCRGYWASNSTFYCRRFFFLHFSPPRQNIANLSPNRCRASWNVSFGTWSPAYVTHWHCITQIYSAEQWKKSHKYSPSNFGMPASRLNGRAFST